MRSLPLTEATTSAEGERWHPVTAASEAPVRRTKKATRKRNKTNDSTCNLVTPVGPDKAPAIKDKSIERFCNSIVGTYLTGPGGGKGGACAGGVAGGGCMPLERRARSIAIQTCS